MVSGGEKADGSPQGSVEIFVPGHGPAQLKAFGQILDYLLLRTVSSEL